MVHFPFYFSRSLLSPSALTPPLSRAAMPPTTTAPVERDSGEGRLRPVGQDSACSLRWVGPSSQGAEATVTTATAAGWPA